MMKLRKSTPKLTTSLLVAAATFFASMPASDARVCADVFGKTETAKVVASSAVVAADIQPLQKADILATIAQIQKVFPYDANKDDLQGLRGHLERVAARQANNAGADRYWVVKTDEGKILGGAGLYFVNDPAERGYWVDWFFVDPSARGMKLGQKLLAKVLERAEEAGINQVNLHTTNRPNEAAANVLYEKAGFKIFATGPETSAPGRVALAEGDGRPVMRIFRRWQKPGTQGIGQDFMPGGPYKGDLLDTRYRSLRLMTKFDTRDFSPVFLRQHLMVGNINHETGFVNASFALGDVSRVILQDVPPKNPAVMDVNHARMRFDFSRPVELLDPQTGELVGRTSSLTISIGPQAREIDQLNGVDSHDPETRAAVYQLLTLEAMALRVRKKEGHEIRQHEFQVDQETKARLLMHALDQGDKLGSQILFDDWWVNCTTQLYSIMAAALDGKTENLPLRQRVTSYFQNQAKLAPKIVNKRFWGGLINEIEAFQHEKQVQEIRARQGAGK